MPIAINWKLTPEAIQMVVPPLRAVVWLARSLPSGELERVEEFEEYHPPQGAYDALPFSQSGPPRKRSRLMPST
jgi:hypothetical protein